MVFYFGKGKSEFDSRQGQALKGVNKNLHTYAEASGSIFIYNLAYCQIPTFWASKTTHPEGSLIRI